MSHQDNFFSPCPSTRRTRLIWTAQDKKKQKKGLLSTPDMLRFFMHTNFSTLFSSFMRVFWNQLTETYDNTHIYINPALSHKRHQEGAYPLWRKHNHIWNSAVFDAHKVLVAHLLLAVWIPNNDILPFFVRRNRDRSVAIYKLDIPLNSVVYTAHKAR